MTPEPGPRLVRYDAIGPEAYADYMDEWEAEGGTIVPLSSARKGLSFDERMAQWREGETEVAFQKGFVPSTTYFLVLGTRILGALSHRPVLNERLLQNGGNIGYGVRPSERRRGYAKLMVGRLLSGLAGPGRVLLTCDETNLASRATIEACGGVLENCLEWDGVWTRRYWICYPPAMAPETLPPDRPTRLRVLLAEPKTFDNPLFVVVVDALLDTMARHQERFQSKNAVLAQFRTTLVACRKATDADKDRICGYLERVMEIQGVPTSDGMLDAWVSGLPF